MAHSINEALQALLDQRKAYEAAAARYDAGEISIEDRNRVAQALVLAQANHDKLKAAQAEELESLRRNPSGRVAPGEGASGDFGMGEFVRTDDDAAALSPLPKLSAQTQRALRSLHRPTLGTYQDPRAAASAVVLSAMSGAMLPPQFSAALQREGSDPAGGFALPGDVAVGIYARAAEESLWLRLGARIEPMTGPDKTFVAFDDDDETNGAEAGMTPQFGSEGVAPTAQEAKLRRVKLHADTHTILTKVGIELDEDAPDFMPALEAAMGRGLGKRFDRVLLTGLNGTTSGLLTSPALITITKVSGQGAATIIWRNVCDMWSRLSPGSHENSVWITTPTALPQLLTLSTPIGVAGTVPAAAFAAGGPTGYTMMGRPVYITSRTKALGTAGDLILTDPSQLVIGLRRGIYVERSPHAHFDEGIISVRARMRACAATIWDTPQTGVDLVTRSPYVVIETRA
jgi:HK97 family phage major capsid protein